MREVISMRLRFGWSSALLLILLQMSVGDLATARAQVVPNSRPPANDAEAQGWLENMVWHHHFTDHEIRRATGWTFTQIAEMKNRLNILDDNGPRNQNESRLRVLPYPGGRHPRIGFLDGAVEPQRETKVSVFLPWDPTSYVVADVPEAIWSNLGLTYLAHTHINTIWDQQGSKLEPLEWEAADGDQYHCRRRLPNGISFETSVAPSRDHVKFVMTLTNGTNDELTDLRVQNCVMLKGATGFQAQSNDNKRLLGPYATSHDETGTRWIITAWLPLHRCWANENCPCLHSDPKFPDCKPGETVEIKGWLSFYEGTDIVQEVERINALNWWE